MGTKLYVGNLSFDVTEENMRELFTRVGEVTSVNLITDSHTGRMKGFGFVEMASGTDAKKAIQELNGTIFVDRALIVDEAKPLKPRERGGFGGGRGGRGDFHGSRSGREGR